MGSPEKVVDIVPLNDILKSNLITSSYFIVINIFCKHAFPIDTQTTKMNFSEKLLHAILSKI